MLKRALGIVCVIALAAVMVGCANQKAPAEAAIAAADTAFTAVQADAAKYVPDEAKAIAGDLQAAKDLATKGDYKGALAAAQALPAKITALGTAVAAKKTELTATWTSLSGALPGVVAAIQSRVDILGKAKKLPQGLDKAKFEEAKAGLAELNTTWAAATSAFGSGEIKDAIAKAETVKTTAAGVMEKLGMTVPAALQAAAK